MIAGLAIGIAGSDKPGQWTVVGSSAAQLIKDKLMKTTLRRMVMPSGMLTISFSITEPLENGSLHRKRERRFIGSTFTIANLPNVGVPVDVPAFLGREVFRALKG